MNTISRHSSHDERRDYGETMRCRGGQRTPTTAARFTWYAATPLKALSPPMSRLYIAHALDAPPPCASAFDARWQLLAALAHLHSSAARRLRAAACPR